MNKEKSIKGITLISLVITIIVLLILAGISIMMLTGDNSILKQAVNAREKTIVEAEKERIQLVLLGKYNYKENMLESTVKSKLEKEIKGISISGTKFPLIVTYTSTTGNSYEVYEDGTVKKYTPIDLTDIYVALCADGTLVFSNNKHDINTYLSNNNTTLHSGWDSIKDLTNNDVTYTEYADEITKAIFLNEVVPQTTLGLFSSLKNLTTIENISNLKTDNVTDMSYMFQNCSSLTNLDLSSFNTRNVTDIRCMFEGCSNLINIDLSSFDTGNVEFLHSLFSGCLKLSDISSISKWNVSSVKNMYGTFLNCVSLADLEPLANWDTSSLEYLKFTFGIQKSVYETYGLGKIEDLSPLENWNTSAVTNMDQLFRNQSIKNSNGIENWDISSTTTMEMMFQNCKKLEYLNLSNYNTATVTNMKQMFENTSSLNAVYVGEGWNTSNATTKGMFNGSKIRKVTIAP